MTEPVLHALAKAEATAAFHQERAANAEYLAGVWERRCLEMTDVKRWQDLAEYWQKQATDWREIAQELDADRAWTLYDERKGFTVSDTLEVVG